MGVPMKSNPKNILRKLKHEHLLIIGVLLSISFYLYVIIDTLGYLAIWVLNSQTH